jgi:predicted secreted protein
MNENTSEEIKLKTGESKTIKLKGLATAGYQWSYSADDKKDCITISKDYKKENGDEKKAGASTDEVFTIIAKKAGSALITFTQQRSWEKNTEPLNEKKIKVVVE